MIWGAWKTRNQAIFYYIYIAPGVYASKLMVTLSHFPQYDGPPKVRRIIEDIIDKYGCWSNFDGASQGLLGMGGEWGIIHLFDSHWILFFASMAMSINNHVEMMALKLVMILAHSKGVSETMGFWGSKASC